MWAFIWAAPRIRVKRLDSLVVKIIGLERDQTWVHRPISSHLAAV